ncbi:DUF4160 domain-containing protein [Polymorphobacter sp. PAMC 29334]|uniref:DUF4160 domain-containing protein n=1 Tax=Polymorphobacter sp. PAMC 29334 TaxID=2862331 RepID=UPI001C67644F|nr:DUF4160 domain-containing protein [Polymorphobacter sp. PAMC 29334]QYE34254.1 DUF4160 domain-containing protein [Polymorphobacter sp. PAMC 29334]
MPTIYREAGYRFHFYAQDHAPPHVHVEKDGRSASFFLRPVRIASNDGFKARDLARLETMVRLSAKTFEDAWHGHFGTTDE